VEQYDVRKCEMQQGYEGRVCSFDYKSIFQESPCTQENEFGYTTGQGCVLLKLNKIIGWKPKGKNVIIRCEGETSADRDNLKAIKYHYDRKDLDFIDNEGVLEGRHYPFMGHRSYRAPFIFAQFDIPADTLVNIECRAYDLDKIDSKDRLNCRGMTKFSLYVFTNEEIYTKSVTTLDDNFCFYWS
jgi:sodium/potassium-transporting ATPase subunit beta